MGIGECDSLNKNGDGATIGIEDIARQVVRLNFGTHRLLSAIVRERRKMAIERNRLRPDELADRIEAMLNEDLF